MLQQLQFIPSMKLGALLKLLVERFGLKTRLAAQKRLELIEEVTKSGLSISKLCKKYNISRFTFYKWKKRYDQAKAENRLDSLKDQNPQGHLHWKRIPEETEARVVEIINQNPTHGIRKIHKLLPLNEAGKPIVGIHGVRNIFTRLGIKSEKKQFVSVPISLKDIPQKEIQTKLITPETRLSLIEEVTKFGSSVFAACKKFNVSRQTFYKWKKCYDSAKLSIEDKLEVLKDHKIRGEAHWKVAPKEAENMVLNLVINHPELSTHKIADMLPQTSDGKRLIGNHGVQNIFQRLNLNTYDKRLTYSNSHKRVEIPQISISPEKVEEVPSMPFLPQAPPLAPPQKFDAATRLALIEEVTKKGSSVSAACKKYNISRFTFYKWKKYYDQASAQEKFTVLSDHRPRGETHWQGTPKEIENLIISRITESPELSAGKISQTLPKDINGKPVLGNHGVQNVLLRYGLNTFEKRLEYSKAHKAIPAISIPKPTTVISPEIPIFQPSTFKQTQRSLLSTVKFVLRYIVTASVSSRSNFVTAVAAVTGTLLITMMYFKMLGQAQPGTHLGLISASISLTFGFFFFLYSLKYYLTIALVLGFSKKLPDNGKNGNGHNGNGNGPKGLLAKIFGIKNGNGYVNGNGINGNGYTNGNTILDTRGIGLISNLEGITLESHPFVSIHLATYNEKRVIDRLLTAATTQDYDNYEVVVVDDSTDETVDILNRWSSHPKVKVIHRENRSGFKGGALKVALENTNPLSEFIIVFDADFIPYPDTITQFLKYFKAATGGDKLSSFQDYKDSPIAAIQGYQWHVLNKSENWLTRGVRSEFAGSYVMERSGNEVLGALKQIAGAVYMIRRDVLQAFGWGTSITEDFQLTLKIYEAGYKVIYTPYIQAPSECVSTVKRLIRQRMRWAEGHTHNIRKMFTRMLTSPNLTKSEKTEFFYLSPYYLQSAFFMVGTLAWFLSETVLKAKLPFWTSLWGWSLVFSNLLSLPLMNSVGLFLEESEEKDYLGILSFIGMSYLLVPFQAYASIKGLIEKEEGPWFRTPKTGRITDILTRGHFYRWLNILLPWRGNKGVLKQELPNHNLSLNPYLSLSSANSRFNNFKISRKPSGNSLINYLILTVIFTLISLSFYTLTKKAFTVPSPVLITTSFLLSSPIFLIKNIRGIILSKAALTIVLILVLEVNYLAFFASPIVQKLLNNPVGKTILGNNNHSTAYAANDKDEIPFEQKEGEEFLIVSPTDETKIAVLSDKNVIRIVDYQMEVKDDSGFEIRVPSTDKDEPKKIEGSRVIYETDGGTLTLIAKKKGLGVEINLLQKPTKNTFDFKIEKGDFNFEKQEDGSYLVRLKNTDQLIFGIEKPIVEGINETVGLSIDGAKIQYEISESFLTNSNTQYPILIKANLIRLESSLNLKDTSNQNDKDYDKEAKLLDKAGKVFFGEKGKDYIGYKIVSGRDENYSIKFKLKDYQGKFKDSKGEKYSLDSTDGLITTNYKLIPHGVKADYVLNQKPPVGFLLSSDVEKEGDMDIVLNDSDKSWSYVDLDDFNREYFTLPKPTIKDANNQSGTIQLNLSDQGRKAVFDIDQNFLNSAIYPVIIDPTSIATVDPGGTSYIQATTFMNQTYSSTATTDKPLTSGTTCSGVEACTNSLGLFKYNANYNNGTIYFEAVINNSVSGATTYSSLYTSASAQVSGSEVSTTSTTYTRVRSGSITLVDLTDYTARMRVSANTGSLNQARVIIIQSGSTIISTQTNISLGDDQSTASGTYATLTNQRNWYFDSSKYDGNLTAYFQGSFLELGFGGVVNATAYAQLYNLTDSEAVTGSEVSNVNNKAGYVLARSGAITIGASAGNLKTGKEYAVQIKLVTNGATTGYIASAHVVLVQTGTPTKIRTYQELGYPTTTSTSATYARQNLNLNYDATEWLNVTNAYYFEATMKISTTTRTAYAKIRDETTPVDLTNGEISTTSASAARITSNALSGFPEATDNAVTLDMEIKISATTATATINSSWLIVDITTGGRTNADQFRGQRSLLRDSSGNYYAVYYDANYDINVKKSTDKGATWAAATTQTEDIRNLSAGIDSSNNLHIAVQTSGGVIKYYKFTTASSAYSSAVTLEGIDIGYKPNLTIDANDYPSVTWTTNKGIKYSRAAADPTSLTNWVAGNSSVNTVTNTITQEIDLWRFKDWSQGFPDTGYQPSGTSCGNPPPINPNDNCRGQMGTFKYKSADFNGQTIYFEAVIKTSNGANTAYARLADTAETEVTNSVLSTTSTTYTRLRSSSITLTDNTDYIAQGRRTADTYSASVTAARVIIVQSAAPITTTTSRVPIGVSTSGSGAVTSCGWSNLTDAPIWYFDSSKYDGTLSVYFEAVMLDDGGVTANARLYNVTDAEGVTNSAVSTTGGAPSATRSSTAMTIGNSSGNLKPLKQYSTQICRTYPGGASPSGEMKIYGASVVVVQSRTAGITKTRIYIPFTANRSFTAATSTYAAQNQNVYFDPVNEWSNVTNTYYHEATMKTSAGTGYVKVKDETTPADITNAEITTTSTSATRITSSALSSVPVSAKTFDVELKNNSTNTTTVSASWLIIDVQMNAGTNKIDQYIDFINQQYARTSATYGPTGTVCNNPPDNCNNGLGAFKWTSGSYTGATVYFEAVIKTISGATAYAHLNDTSGTEVSGSVVSTTSSSLTRVRSGAITLTDGTSYTTQIKNSSAVYTTTLNAARVIINQASSTIYKTETDIGIGGYHGTYVASYTTITDAPRWYFDSTKYDGTLSAYFQADLSVYTNGTAYAQLYNLTDSEAVTGSAVSSNSSTGGVLVRSSALTIGAAAGNLKTAKEYVVQVNYGGGNQNPYLWSAHVVLTQDGGASVLTKVRTYQKQTYKSSTSTNTSYETKNFLMYFDTSEWSNVSNTYYFETTMKTSANTGYAKLRNDTDATDFTNSEISTTNTSVTRVTSSSISNMPTSGAKQYDLYLKVSASATVTVASSWLIIDVTINTPPSAVSLDLLGQLSGTTTANFHAMIVNVPGTPNVGSSGNGDLWIFYQNGNDGDLYYVRGTIATGYKWSWGTPTVQTAGSFSTTRYLDLATAPDSTNNRVVASWTNFNGTSTYVTKALYISYSGATPTITDASPVTTDFGRDHSLATGTYNGTFNYYFFYRNSSGYIAFRSTSAASISWSDETILDQADTSLGFPALKVDDQPSATPKLDLLYIQRNSPNNIYFHTWHMKETYSRQGTNPTGSNDGTVYLDELGYSNVTTDDTNFESVASTSNNPTFVFKARDTLGTPDRNDQVSVSWKGYSSIGAATNNIYLQVYNFTSTSWETVTTQTTSCSSSVDQCTITGSKGPNASDYIDTNYWSYWKVYQATGTQTLYTNIFSFSWIAVPEKALILLLFVPFLPRILRRIRSRRKDETVIQAITSELKEIKKDILNFTKKILGKILFQESENSDHKVGDEAI